MNEKHNELLTSTKEALESFLTGNSSFNETKTLYENLLYDYNRGHSEKLIQNSKNEKHIKGILYEHNINNFSKSSAIYLKTGKNYSRFEDFGEEKLMNISDKFINDNSTIINEKDILEQRLKSINSLNFTLYSVKFNTEHGEYIISSISSSNYFSIDRFKYFCNIIFHIYSNNTKFSIPLSFNYIESLEIEIADYIKKLKEDEELKIKYFIFKNIHTIFSHMGIHVYYEISDSIINMLKDYYGNNSKILILSKSRYLVLYNNKTELNNNEEKRQVFVFDNILIKYKTTEIEGNKKLSTTLLLKKLKEIDKLNY